MKIVVMKFGGTSVEGPAAIARTAEIVAGRRDRGQTPVVVVSALAKVTDQLLVAAAAAERGDRTGALAISSRLRNRHLDVACSLLNGTANGTAVAPLHAWLDEQFQALDDLLRGLAAVQELTPRTIDLVASYGERLSSRMIGDYYAQCGLNGIHIDARSCIVTDDQHGKATPLEEKIEHQLRQLVLPLLEKGHVPVLGGFIGATESGVTTTLGRGGSDYTGALVGRGLNAEAIEIWTDVNGIMTTDPRVCPEALRVKSISFEEAAELAYFGAKVLHPATILPAVQKNIPVWVLNSKDPSNHGTEITASARHSHTPFKSIAIKRKLTIIDIVASRMLMAHGYLKAIFDIFDKHKCVIDMVSTSEVSISVTVDSNQRLPELAADLSQLADVKYEGQKALICMVGENIRGQHGIAAQVFSAIRHVNVRMISQGASEINMSFMIEEEDVEEAVRALHQHFFQDPDPEIFDVVARESLAGVTAAGTFVKEG
ncbi:MAG TPA: lysine-sensitive aspartokinase 3 [Acidobacteriaceae bacterium]|nr:lysine-sensitive aspartokinase 3 [Acidobacteriaceae bacterium]